MSDNVYFLAELTIKQGEFDNFKALVEEMVETTQANEPNTLNYEWSITEDSQSCHIYERYADSAAILNITGRRCPFENIVSVITSTYLKF